MVCSCCLKVKPMRASHCKICGTCFLRRDHHCIWIMNCIGYNNYASFFYFLWYLWYTGIYITYCYLTVMYTVIYNKHYPLLLSYVCCLEFCGTLLLTVLLLYLNIFHLWISIKGYTTSEYMLNYFPDPNRPRSDYDISCWENLKSVFGSNFWECMLPCVKRKDDGRYYKKYID